MQDIINNLQRQVENVLPLNIRLDNATLNLEANILKNTSAPNNIKPQTAFITRYTDSK